MRRQSGITLIGLVVTIIVVLIMSVVSVYVGAIDNGILSNAQLAISNYSDGEIKEKISLAYADYIVGQKALHKGSFVEILLETDLPIKSIYGSDSEGYKIIVLTRDGLKQFEISSIGVLGNVTKLEDAEGIDNPYKKDSWEYAYVYKDGNWSGLITKGNEAEGDIVAKFYKQDEQITPESWIEANYLYGDTLLNLNVQFPQNNAYHLVIEGKGNIGGVGTKENSKAWQAAYLDYVVNYTNTQSIPEEVILTPYITKATICAGITGIGDDLFANFTSMRSVDIANTVTNIGDNVFEKCKSLNTIVIPDNVTTLGKFCFKDCENLKNIVLSDSLITIDGYAFSYCTNLKSIIIPDNVISLGYNDFVGCSNLESVVLGKNLTTIGASAFLECSSLKNINIPDSVTTIEERAFYNCTGLTTVNMGNGLISIEQNVFEGCTNLNKVVLGNGLTNIGNYAFRGCTSLTSIVIPQNVVTIGNYAFAECASLNKVVIAGNVTSIGSYAFAKCTGISNFVLPKSVTTLGQFVFNKWNNNQNILAFLDSDDSKWDRKWSNGCDANIIFRYSSDL